MRKYITIPNSAVPQRVDANGVPAVRPNPSAETITLPLVAEGILGTWQCA